MKDLTMGLWLLLDLSNQVICFFNPDMTFGNLTVSQAQAIDISWNLFIDRGLQGLIRFTSYQTVTRSFTRIVEIISISYKLFEEDDLCFVNRSDAVSPNVILQAVSQSDPNAVLLSFGSP